MSDKKLTEIELDALLMGESIREHVGEKFNEEIGVVAANADRLVLPEFSPSIIQRDFDNDLRSRTDDYTVSGNSMTFPKSSEPKPKRKVEMLAVSKQEPVKSVDCCVDCDECNLCDCTEVCKKIEPAKVSWLRRCPSKNAIIALLAAALWFSLSGLSVDVVPSPSPSPAPSPTPSIVVDAPSVLFATDGKTGLTIEQATVIQSQKVQEFCDKNGIDYRRFDIEDDLSTELEHWRKMMKEASEAGVPCMVLITADGKGRIEEIPSTTDEAIKKLGEIK